MRLEHVHFYVAVLQKTKVSVHEHCWPGDPPILLQFRSFYSLELTVNNSRLTM